METRETISLDSRAQHRLYVLTHLLAGALTADEAARVLRLSTRQVRRLADRYRTEGAVALVHGNRGRTPINRTDPAVRARLVELATTEFAGFNPVHLAETLADEGHPELAVSPRTIRRILAGAGQALPRTRRPARHRSRRERMPRAGMLLQVDGSRHDWLEGRGPLLTLIGAIDDATGIVTAATFRDAEDAAGYLEVFRRTVIRHGRPLAVYSDRHGIFIKDPNRPPTLAEQLAGKRSFTQVGRALDEAAIAWIGASSPQAKAGSSACGGPSRTGSPPSCGEPVPRRSSRPTSCSPATCPATTGGSPSPRPTRSRPGGRGRTSSTSMACSGSAIRGGLPTTRPSPGPARAWPCHGDRTAAAGPVGQSPSRNGSTAACGSAPMGPTSG